MLSPTELARLTNVSTDTLRHYERKGLIASPVRTRSGYRRYAPVTVARVLLIQRSLAIGFSLADLARVLGERDKGGAPCRSVHALVTARLADLDRRIDELHALRRELSQLIKEWDVRLATVPRGTQARLLETLDRPIIEGIRSQAGRKRLTRKGGESGTR